jgi:hypothetical protein
MIKELKLIILLAVLIVAGNFQSFSQEVEPEVSINMEGLSQEAQQFASTMQRDLTNYLRQQKYSGKDWEGSKVPINITVYLSGGNNGRFSAKLLFSSSRIINDGTGGRSTMTRFFDEKWSFEFMQGANFTFNPLRCDRFLSLIDFYTLIAIGLDVDTYEELGGNPYYRLARDIANTCREGGDAWKTFAQPGEFTRFNLITEILDPRYEEMRRLIFTYQVDGLDLMSSNKDQALINAEKFTNDLADFKQNKLSGPSTFLQALFDAKAQELANLFLKVNNKKAIKNLKYLDPANSMLYDGMR